MPRGRRRSTPDAQTLEQQLAELKQRQAELKRQLRLMQQGGSDVRKLEEKLVKQLSQPKWTVQQIKEVQPDWDDWGFYQAVRAKQPAPRGRRPRLAVTEQSRDWE